MTGATTCVVSIITVVANAVVRVRRQPMRRSTDTWVRADDTAADTTSTST